jgi:hypothetical protein
MKRLRAGLELLQEATWLALRRLPALGIECAGLLVAWLIFCGLLNLPDSHVWDVAISAMGWPLLLAGWLWLQVIVLRRIRLATPRAALAWAIPTLLLWVIVWAVAATCLTHVAGHFTEYASYLNSRLPAQGRMMLTFDRISGLMEDAYAVLQWWLLPGMLLPCLMETVTSGMRAGTVRRIVTVWRGWGWWLTLLPANWVARSNTHRLLVHHSLSSAQAEIMSVLGRSLLIGLVDVALAYFVLSLLATYLSKPALAGTPETSQPRTAEKP